jgi:hypothetical protein
MKTFDHWAMFLLLVSSKTEGAGCQTKKSWCAGQPNSGCCAASSAWTAPSKVACVTPAASLMIVVANFCVIIALWYAKLYIKRYSPLRNIA